jgi:hypothetical protein
MWLRDWLRIVDFYAGRSITPFHRARLIVAEPLRWSRSTPVVRDELLTVTEFYTLQEARVLVAAFQTEHNLHRPHSSLGDLAPSCSPNDGR